jgi:hypothetical protein
LRATSAMTDESSAAINLELGNAPCLDKARARAASCEGDFDSTSSDSEVDIAMACEL